MKFIDPLTEQSREWLNTLRRQVLEASYDQTPSALSYCFEALYGMGPTRDLLERLRHLGVTDLTVGAYLNPDARSLPRLPLASELRSACFLGICDRITTAAETIGGGNAAVPTILRYMGMGKSPLERVEAFKTDIFSPLMDELDRSLVKGDWLLGLLWRYKREVEWFEQDELLARYGPSGVDRRGWKEADLEQHLQRFLHRGGVAFPFSQPRIPEGRPDIVLPSEETPLPIEVKVYDGAGRGVAQIAGGARQALDYAHKYQSPFGYLVVFNVAEVGIQIGTAPEPGIPRLDKQNKGIFIVPIQVAKLGTPSKQGHVKTVVIGEEDFN